MGTFDETYAIPSTIGDNRPLILNGFGRTVITMEDEEYKRTCCCSTKVLGLFFLIISTIFVSGKYIVLRSDRELIASATILTFDEFFDSYYVQSFFMSFHIMCLLSLFIAVSIRKRQFLLPYILNQVFLITFELIVAITCIVFAASNSVTRIYDGCETVLQEFFPPRTVEVLTKQGDTVVVMTAGLMCTLMVMINSIMLSALNRLYRYYRFVSFYRI